MQKTITIEIGENLLSAIYEVVTRHDGWDIGEAVQKAFGIDFSKIVNNKFIELEDNNHAKSNHKK